MTIAACFLSSEGVVLGADSTVTLPAGKGAARYFNHEQKVFEVGEGHSLGLAFWGSVPIATSYRTVIAAFADVIRDERPGSVERVAGRWGQHAWSSLRSAHKKHLENYDSAQAKVSSGRLNDLTEEELSDASLVAEFETGFCIGGHYGSDHAPAAFEMRLELRSSMPPTPKALTPGRLSFWGVPNMFRRLLHGVDWRVLDAILDAKRDDGTKLWVGTEDELYDRAFRHTMLVHPGLPIREAIDLVHFSIEATIKALKFSHYAEPTCGGPIEVAVVTSDRQFRWVRHKSFESAISGG